ncbi:MAG: hypothetical protein Q4C42_11115 [Clostridia bacterium]|nr:hypothetical protein [Clostridia bacterium]
MNTEKNMLHDEALEEVTGGAYAPVPHTTAVVEERDENGNAIHFSYDGKKWHYECPNCHRILHAGSWGALYCDPCNTYFKVGTAEYAVYD